MWIGVYPLTTINLLWAHLLQCLAFTVFPMPTSIYFSYFDVKFQVIALFLSQSPPPPPPPANFNSIRFPHFMSVLYVCINCMHREQFQKLCSFQSFCIIVYHIWEVFSVISSPPPPPPISLICLSFSSFFLWSFICCRSLILFYLEKLSTVYWAKCVKQTEVAKVCGKERLRMNSGGMVKYWFNVLSYKTTWIIRKMRSLLHSKNSERSKFTRFAGIQEIYCASSILIWKIANEIDANKTIFISKNIS